MTREQFCSRKFEEVTSYRAVKKAINYQGEITESGAQIVIGLERDTPECSVCDKHAYIGTKVTFCHQGAVKCEYKL